MLRYERLRTRLTTGRHGRILEKVTLYSAFGVINTLVDYGVFFAARKGFEFPPFVVALRWVADFLHLNSTETVSLVASNVVAWVVAVTGSYIMNSLFTFGSESGRHLRWKDYFAFFTSGIAAVVTNTIVLVVTAQVLFFPVWLAKAISACASVVLNFCLVYLVVFKPAVTTPPTQRSAPETGAPKNGSDETE